MLRRKSLTFLIVEDDPSQRWVFESSLGDEITYIHAETCEEGLAKLSPGMDLVILDYETPKGCALAVAAKAKELNIPVLIQSGTLSLVKLGELMNAGASRVLFKPYKVNMLRDYVFEILIECSTIGLARRLLG